MISLSRKAPPPRRSKAEGFTLVEVLVVVALIALLGGGVLLGPGLLRSSHVRAAATLIVSGVRLGITRANNSGRPVRLVIDFESRRVLLEEAASSRFVRDKSDVAGGAEASSDREKEEREKDDAILDGPRAPRATFTPLTELRDPDGGTTPGRALGTGVELVSVQTEHDEDPVTEGRAYVYFWPGGITERAVIQLRRSGGDDPGMTVLVSALTGRAKIERGLIELAPVLEEDDHNEVETGQ